MYSITASPWHRCHHDVGGCMGHDSLTGCTYDHAGWVWNGLGWAYYHTVVSGTESVNRVTVLYTSRLYHNTCMLYLLKLRSAIQGHELYTAATIDLPLGEGNYHPVYFRIVHTRTHRRSHPAQIMRFIKLSYYLNNYYE
jgi:hypothetical protein